MATERVENLVDSCLPHVLATNGHSIYLRHPQTREVVLVGHEASAQDAARKLTIFRRILCGIVHESLVEWLRDDRNAVSGPR